MLIYMVLWQSSHGKSESVSVLLESGLAWWLILINGVQQNWNVWLLRLSFIRSYGICFCSLGTLPKDCHKRNLVYSTGGWEVTWRGERHCIWQLPPAARHGARHHHKLSTPAISSSMCSAMERFRLNPYLLNCALFNLFLVSAFCCVKWGKQYHLTCRVSENIKWVNAIKYLKILPGIAHTWIKCKLLYNISIAVIVAVAAIFICLLQKRKQDSEWLNVFPKATELWNQDPEFLVQSLASY